jgi:hypothetical protein
VTLSARTRRRGGTHTDDAILYLRCTSQRIGPAATTSLEQRGHDADHACIRQIKQLALDTGMLQQDLMVEAVNDLFVKKGKHAIAI